MRLSSTVLLVVIYLLVNCIACTDPATNKKSQNKTQEELNTDTTKNKDVVKNPNEGLVARVNSEGITQAEFDEIYEQRVRTYRIKNKPVPERLKYTYKAAVLQKLINQKLLDQYMNEIKISLTATEEREAIDAYKKRLNGEKGFKRFIEKSGKSEDQVYRRIKHDALIKKTLLQETSSQVTQKELQDYYDKYSKTRYTEEAQVRISHILLPVAKNANKKLVRKKKKQARSLYKKLRKKPESFAQTAQKESGDFTSKARRGDLGYFARTGIPFISKEFEKAVSQLKEGEISDLVRTEQGFHIIKLTDKQDAQIKVSHILLKKPESQAKAQEIYQRALQEDFTALSKEVSEDERTRIRGGDLGYIYPKSRTLYGETFKKACLELEAGEVKGDIKSDLGIHIVKALHKRKQRLRASHILIKVAPKASKKLVKEARQKAKKILDELKKNPKSAASRFVRLTKKYSEDYTKDRGGDLGIFYIGGQPKISQAFEEKAFSLQINQISTPVRSHLGWHILMLTDKKESKQRTFEEVKQEITDRIQKKKMQFAKSNLLKQLRMKAKIEEFIQTRLKTKPHLRKLQRRNLMRNKKMPLRQPIHLRNKSIKSKKMRPNVIKQKLQKRNQSDKGQGRK